MKQRGYRLSPNEEVAILRKQQDERRIARLIQVREQDRGLAKMVRKDVHDKKEEERQALETHIQASLANNHQEELKELELRYLHRVKQLGQGHRAALSNIQEENREQELRVLLEAEQKWRAETRYEAAMKEVSAQRLREEARKKEIQENRRKVIEVEKERAHKAADRQYPIPPTEPLIMNFVANKGTRVQFKDANNFASSYYHIPPTVVQRASPVQNCANEMAREKTEADRLIQKHIEATKLEQDEKAQLRHKHALAKVKLEKEKSEMMEQLKILEREDRSHRQKSLARMPSNIFQPIQQRLEMAFEQQKEMEEVFEKLFTKISRHHDSTMDRSGENKSSELSSESTSSGTTKNGSTTTTDSTDSTLESRGPIRRERLTELPPKAVHFSPSKDSHHVTSEPSYNTGVETRQFHRTLPGSPKIHLQHDSSSSLSEVEIVPDARHPQPSTPPSYPLAYHYNYLSPSSPTPHAADHTHFSHAASNTSSKGLPTTSSVSKFTQTQVPAYLPPKLVTHLPIPPDLSVSDTASSVSTREDSKYRTKDRRTEPDVSRVASRSKSSVYPGGRKVPNEAMQKLASLVKAQHEAWRERQAARPNLHAPSNSTDHDNSPSMMHNKEDTSNQSLGSGPQQEPPSLYSFSTRDSTPETPHLRTPPPPSSRSVTHSPPLSVSPYHTTMDTSMFSPSKPLPEQSRIPTAHQSMLSTGTHPFGARSPMKSLSITPYNTTLETSMLDPQNMEASSEAQRDPTAVSKGWNSQNESGPLQDESGTVTTNSQCLGFHHRRTNSDPRDRDVQGESGSDIPHARVAGLNSQGNYSMPTTKVVNKYASLAPPVNITAIEAGLSIGGYTSPSDDPQLASQLGVDKIVPTSQPASVPKRQVYSVEIIGPLDTTKSSTVPADATVSSITGHFDSSPPTYQSDMDKTTSVIQPASVPQSRIHPLYGSVKGVGPLPAPSLDVTSSSITAVLPSGADQKGKKALSSLYTSDEKRSPSFHDSFHLHYSSSSSQAVSQVQPHPLHSFKKPQAEAEKVIEQLGSAGRECQEWDHPVITELSKYSPKQDKYISSPKLHSPVPVTPKRHTRSPRFANSFTQTPNFLPLQEASFRTTSPLDDIYTPLKPIDSPRSERNKPYFPVSTHVTDSPSQQLVTSQAQSHTPQHIASHLPSHLHTHSPASKQPLTSQAQGNPPQNSVPFQIPSQILQFISSSHNENSPSKHTLEFHLQDNQTSPQSHMKSPASLSSSAYSAHNDASRLSDSETDRCPLENEFFYADDLPPLFLLPHDTNPPVNGAQLSPLNEYPGSTSSSIALSDLVKQKDRASPSPNQKHDSTTSKQSQPISDTSDDESRTGAHDSDHTPKPSVAVDSLNKSGEKSGDAESTEEAGVNSSPSLQELFMKKKLKFVQRSQHRVQILKISAQEKQHSKKTVPTTSGAKGGILGKTRAQEQGERKHNLKDNDKKPLQMRSPLKANENRIHPPTSEKEKDQNLPVQPNIQSSRKIHKIEMKKRNLRLYNRLPEVRLRKEEENRAKACEENRRKAQLYQQQIRLKMKSLQLHQASTGGGTTVKSQAKTKKPLK